MLLGQLKGRKNKLPYLLLLLASPYLRFLTMFTHALSNNFAALALKPDLKKDLHPWLSHNENGNIKINPTWLKKRYAKNEGSK